MHEARGSLSALDQILLDFSCVAYGRGGVCRVTQIRYLPVTPPGDWGGHSHTTGTKYFSLGGEVLAERGAWSSSVSNHDITLLSLTRNSTWAKDSNII